jgi:hypothetical protein
MTARQAWSRPGNGSEIEIRDLGPAFRKNPERHVAELVRATIES